MLQYRLHAPDVHTTSLSSQMLLMQTYHQIPRVDQPAASSWIANNHSHINMRMLHRIQ